MGLLMRVRRKVELALRMRREVKVRTFPAAAVRNFRFYQFNAGTAAWFFAETGRTDIRVTDTPHYHFAATGDPARYRAYLSASWRTADAARLDGRLEQFKVHIAHVKERPGAASPRPILVQLESGGDFFVVDGNHRCAFAVALGRSLEAEVWPADLAFLKFSDIRRFYGTGHRNRPYQSLWLNGGIVIPGRRTDALERLDMIPPGVLAGKTLLDVASNFGMSALLAKRRGAAACTGLELSPEMVDLASRFAMFDGVFPAVRYRAFNVDDDVLPDGERYDVAFMFSIYDHLRNPARLQEIVRRHVTAHVVFEGHPGATRATYAAFLDGGLFREVTALGSLSESAFSPERNRALWLCRL